MNSMKTYILLIAVLHNGVPTTDINVVQCAIYC